MTDYQDIPQNEAGFILQLTGGILPNLEKITAVFYDESKKSVSALMLSGNDLLPSPVIFGNDFDFQALERMRTNRNRSVWLDAGELPFAEHGELRPFAGQKEVFNESDNSVLIIGIRNNADKKQDLYIYYFNKDATNFGPVRNGEILATGVKSVIENMLYNAIISARREYRKQVREQNKYKTYLGRLRDKAKHMAAKLAMSENEEKQFKIDFANYVLDKITGGRRHDVGLSPEAEHVVGAYKGDLNSMETWIHDAYDFARFSDFAGHGSMLIIEDWHFADQEQQSATRQQQREESVEPRYYKTYALLNRLEEAAVKVVASREKLTGAAVGRAMEHAVSAPAISDSLKKHGSKIASLMEKYPHKWTLIRSEFKPVINVLENRRKDLGRRLTG